MSTVDHIWRVRLVGKHKAFFGSGGYPTCGDGWREVLERMCARIAEAMGQRNSGNLRIVEIKQKFGGLRVYVESDGVPQAVLGLVEEAVELAEARAGCSCEICGAEGWLHNDCDWLTIRCRKHAAGERVAVRREHHNLYVSWTYGRDGGCRRVRRRNLTPCVRAVGLLEIRLRFPNVGGKSG